MSLKHRSLSSLPLPYSTYPNKLLSNLGRPTRRGIKKCPKCGFYNGIRSAMCKNIQCGTCLRDSEEKSSSDFDAMKLVTGTSKQVYSVRVRDMGPDHRGFIQLPVLQNYNDEESTSLSKVALCFVDSCQRSFDDSILKCHEEETSQNESSSFCAHINAAFSSRATAEPIEFCNRFVNIVKVPDEFREKLLILASEKEGPLVQRVSKSVMAVKCQVTPKHPLGYLHFTFVRSKGKEYFDKYFCSCTDFLAFENKLKSNIRFKCIHYFACICALAGHSKYSQEFSYFINNTYINHKINDTLRSSSNVILKNNMKINVISNQIISKQNKKTETTKVTTVKPPRSITKKLSTRKCQKIMPKILPIEIKVLNDTESSNQIGICWKYEDWLTYVTESINNTMILENCGLINSLIFCIPEEFFMNFKKTIPDIYNETQIGLSHIYYIMNILHLKEIFDTPQVKLKISKRFIHNEEKGYVEYNENEDLNQEYHSTFIFFINVGQSTVDESDNTNNSFVIEWVPNVTSISKIGQLKFQYKYGRKIT